MKLVVEGGLMKQHPSSVLDVGPSLTGGSTRS